MVNIEDFYRVRKHNKLMLLIKDLNRRFSISEDQLFYHQHHLPETSTNQSFRKIYSITRIYIDGLNLIKNLQQKDPKEIKELLIEHFNNLPHKKVFSLRRMKEKILIYKFMKRIFKLQKNREKDNFDDKKKQIDYIVDLLYLLRVDLYGIGFLKNIQGNKKIFVMGDISGILRNFSTTQSLQQQQKRRFAATSWGTIKMKAPLQDFMRKFRFVPPTANIEKNISDSETLGRLQIGVATNINYVFDGNNEF